MAVVNTCGFVEPAKKDSIDTLLEAADLKESGRTQAVVAVGCLAERYGEQLAAELPEADAVLGFDDYADLSTRLEAILTGEARRTCPRTGAPCCRSPGRPAGEPRGVARSRRGLVGAVSAARPPGGVGAAGPAGRPPPARRPAVGTAKIASGCDRRCSFCAIPSFRGAFVSRRPSTCWPRPAGSAEGVQELLLVSENSTSYGKDLGDLRLLETLLPELAASKA